MTKRNPEVPYPILHHKWIWVAFSILLSATIELIAEPTKAETSSQAKYSDVMAYLSHFSGDYLTDPISVSIVVGSQFQPDGGREESPQSIGIHLMLQNKSISFNIPKPAKLTYDTPYLIAVGDVRGTIEFQIYGAGEFVWNAAELELTYNGAKFKQIVPDDYFFARYFQNCPLLWQFAQGRVVVHTNPESIVKIVILAKKQGWTFYDHVYGDVGLAVKDFDCNARDVSGDTTCAADIDVGASREFETMKILSGVLGIQCVNFALKGGGSYYEALNGIPLGTLLGSVDSISFANVGAKVRTLLLDSLSGKGVKISDAKQVGSETRFIINVLAPNHIAKLSEKDGYWYFFGIAFTVDFDTFDKGLTESLEMSLNDVVEVKFPEDGPPPSNQVVEGDGRSLLFSDVDGKITPDGVRMIQWTVRLLSQFSEKMGGNVYSSSLDTQE